MEKNYNKIILYIIEQSPRNKVEFDNAKRKACSQLKISQPANRHLLKAYHNLVKKKIVVPNKKLEHLFKKAEVRTLSGIAIVTSLTKPFPCPGNCVYCPSEKKMPKSYIATEPAAARALRLSFDPYEQMQKRIEMLELNGHPTDKIEYIIKGGTWNAYPLKYQYWFILESFKACNNLTRRKLTRRRSSSYGGQAIKQLKEELEVEQEYNDKKAKHKIIGLTLETRPDAISEKTILQMREMGCTRIELGLQAPDDKILKKIKRGHTVEQFREAMFLLRSFGFKVDLHFMPGLPGSNPKKDVGMYKKLFSDPGLKPDMVKIYPCTVIENTELSNWLKKGKYKPYSEKKLFEALLEMKLATPRWCRISRLIRDIPANEIEAGNKITNLREELAKELKKRGEKCVCLRCREIGRSELRTTDYGLQKLFIESYETTGGTEYFLSFEDKQRQAVYGFLRLRLPQQNTNSYALDLKPYAFIRELHTYGHLVKIGKHDKAAAQHKGIGKKLVKEAEKIAKKKSFDNIAVISGVGVRSYYRKLDYRKDKTYMVKSLS